MLDANVLRIHPENRVSLTVDHLTVAVKGPQPKDDEGLSEPVRILNNVSFDLGSGQLLAIMGGSGSGKTTLLNTLSQRLNVRNKKLQFSGRVNYNVAGALPDSKIKNSYMQQDDFFLPGLTVYETMTFQADLRLPSSTTKDEKLHLIDHLLSILELAHLKDKQIAQFSTKKTNLSGGEQRRVSLAIQLLSKPSILFLDEPTTGLDATSSYNLILLLKKLASPEFGITIVLSIHQPRPEISLSFDKICLLTRGGRVVYYGSFDETETYVTKLSQLGFDKSNQTKGFIDRIMDMSVKDASSAENEACSNSRIDALVRLWESQTSGNEKSHSSYLKSEDEQFVSNISRFHRPKDEAISFWRELVILTKRSFILTYRDIGSLVALNGGALLLAVICGWIFYKPKPDLAGIRSITSTLYVMLEVIGFAPMFVEIERLYSTDGIFFYREYKENFVSIPGFILSRRLGKFFLEDVSVAVIFALITYFMWGLRISTDLDGPQTPSYFFIYLAVTILTNFVGMASAMFCFALCDDFAIASLITNAFYQLQNSACGYFVNAATMPVYVRWIKYLAYFWYGFGALTSNQYTNWMGDCPHSDESMCLEYSGKYQLDVLGYPQDWIKQPICILLAWIIGFYLLTAACLYFKPSEMEVAKSRLKTNEKLNSSENEPSGDRMLEQECELEKSSELQLTLQRSQIKYDNKSISVSIDKINLNVTNRNRKYGIIAQAKTELTLLDGVSATFGAGTVNAIMGPSGSGKTTLLNFLSHRLPKTSNYVCSGTIRLNNSLIVSPRKLSTIASYVTQHDNSLIPTLTVRETLYYQAKLRLPVEKHKSIPGIVDTMIRRTGLVDCADTMIGNEFIKGISGGEKRRVSISIQLLSEPAILFLDEPTSGLDSMSAVTVLSLLHKLAFENGTTIIMTIHQPSEEIFNQFESVLLLARGGRLIYNGSSGSIGSYFNACGFESQELFNTADYILDLVSRNANEDKQTADARVAFLVKKWSESHPAKDTDAITFASSETSIDLSNYRKQQLPFSITMPVIFKRQFVNSLRSKDALISRTGQIVILGVVHTLFFAPLKHSKEGIDNRLGLIQEALNLYYVGFLNNISLYPVERDVFYQEYKDGIYGVLEFSASYFLNELPTEIIPNLFFAAMIVFVCGLPRTPAMFFGMFASGFIATNSGESLGILINSIFDHLGLAINLLSSLVIIAIFMAGTMSLHMPPFFQAWNWLSPMKYAVGICANLGLENQRFDCGEAQCTLSTGNAVLDYYGLNANVSVYVGALVACFFVYRVLATAAIFVKVKYFL